MTQTYVCIDWGGSELKGVCLTMAGRQHEFKFSAGNLRQLNEASLTTICQRLAEATLSDNADKTTWLIGAAGADDRSASQKLTNALQKCCPGHKNVHIFSDYACNHAACLAGQDGILSVNGTGSVLYAVNGEKKLKTSGWGYLLDETPSGAFFGRSGLQGLLRHIEGEDGYGEYYQAYRETFGVADRQSIIDELYRSPSLQKQLGKYAPILTAAYSANNSHAQILVADSVKTLVSMSLHLCRAVAATDLKFCGSGGLWVNWAPFRQLVANEMQKVASGLTLVEPICKLHYGPLINFAKTDSEAMKVVEMLKSTGDL